MKEEEKGGREGGKESGREREGRREGGREREGEGGREGNITIFISYRFTTTGEKALVFKITK